MARGKTKAPESDPESDAKEPRTVPEPSTNGSSHPETNGCSERHPLKSFAYPVSREAWVMASVWDRRVELQGGTTFTAYDISVRKRYKDRQSGEMKTLYWFHSSEVYAVVHALNEAAAWVLEARSSADDCPY